MNGMEFADANANLADANRQLIESEQLRRDFNRDVLLAVTGGKLQLVERSELPGSHCCPDKEIRSCCAPA